MTSKEAIGILNIYKAELENIIENADTMPCTIEVFNSNNALQLAVEALANQEILLKLLVKTGLSTICWDMPANWCEENGEKVRCNGRSTLPQNECYLEYCKVKREEKNDSH